jgi:competence protein ComEA
MKSIRHFLPALVMCVALPAQERLPAGPGRDTMKKVCSGCHSAENVVGMGKTQEEWGKVVGEMVERGAKGTEDEFNDVVDYLAAHFPKMVNVNKASTQDFVSSLGFPAEQAEAIVHYREEKGSFKSVEDLEKVPGIDTKRIRAKKDRLEF